MYLPQNYQLEKAIWTHHDFEQMGWHDASIHAFCFENEDDAWTGDLLLDIDYIIKWIEPVEPNNAFSFWVAPCTLIFKECFDCKINIETKDFGLDLLHIENLYCKNKTQQDNGFVQYEWLIELQHAGNIHFKSYGFEQIVRQKPVLVNSQFLTKAQRGGQSFGQSPFLV